MVQFARRALVLVVGLALVACGGDPFTQGIPTAPLDDAAAADAGSACADGGCPDAASDPDGADAACVVRHNNGFGGFNGMGPGDFYDCSPTGSYSATLAMEACQTYFGASKCVLATCDSGVEVVQAYGEACIAWAYGGIDVHAVGRAREGAVGGSCQCPGQGDTVWY
jgi:hypothetical protein